MKFNFKRTALCSLAFGWIALFWGSYDSFMQIVDYDVFGLSSIWHGVIIASDNILGLIFLPLFGKLSDATKGERFGKRKPYIIFGTIVEMIGFAGVCLFASLGKDYFIPFLICLLFTLASMAAYRSPALALVPDVNPDKYRSKANAVSNVVSVITTVLALVYYYVFMPPNFEGFWAYGAAMILTTLALLIWFCISVKEVKFRSDMFLESNYVAEMEAIDAECKRKNGELQLPEENPTDAEETAYSTSHALDVVSFTEDSMLHLPSFDSALRHESYLEHRSQKMEEAESGVKKKKSFRENVNFGRLCILAIVFCFYMAYNALTSNFIKYAEYILHFAKGQAIIPLILAQLSAMLAFPLASWLSGKIGRRNTILIGFALMLTGFGASIAFTTPHPLLYVLFMVLGVSFGLTMVNIYPFFLESSESDKIGQDTGVFSVAMTLAMVVTPILSGFLIDTTGGWFGGGENAGFSILFPYCMVFLVLAFILTALIKNKKPHEL